MGDIVNLRLARKQKARRDKDQLAQQKRILHGRTKLNENDKISKRCVSTIMLKRTAVRRTAMYEPGRQTISLHQWA
jgi:hypothetical protein